MLFIFVHLRGPSLNNKKKREMLLSPIKENKKGIEQPVRS